MIRAELGIAGEFPKEPSYKPVSQKGFWLGKVPQTEIDKLQTIRDIAYDNTVDKINAFLKSKGLEEEFRNFKI